MKKTAAFCLCLVLTLMICACAEIPPASSEPNEPSATPEPTPTEAVSATPEATPTPVPTKKPTSTPTAKPTPTVAVSVAPPKYLPYITYEKYEELKPALETLDAESVQGGTLKDILITLREQGWYYAPCVSNEIRFNPYWQAKVGGETSEVNNHIGFCLDYAGVHSTVYVYSLTAAQKRAATEKLHLFTWGKECAEDESGTACIQKKIMIGDLEKETCGMISKSGKRYQIWYLLDDSHLVCVDWSNTSRELAEEFVSKLEFEKVELKTGKPNLPSTPITPEAGITPIVTPPVGEIVPNA